MQDNNRDVVMELFTLNLIVVFVYMGMSRGLYIFEPTVETLVFCMVGVTLGYIVLFVGEKTNNYIVAKKQTKLRKLANEPKTRRGKRQQKKKIFK